MSLRHLKQLFSFIWFHSFDDCKCTSQCASHVTKHRHQNCRSFSFLAPQVQHVAHNTHSTIVACALTAPLSFASSSFFFGGIVRVFDASFPSNFAHENLFMRLLELCLHLYGFYYYQRRWFSAATKKGRGVGVTDPYSSIRRTQHGSSCTSFESCPGSGCE